MPDDTPPAADQSHLSTAPELNTWTVLRTIIESLADGIVIVDPRGAIRFTNPAAARLFNRTPEGLVGTMLGSPLIEGEATEMEIVRRGGGDVVYAELRTVKTQWEGETAELVSLRDVTDRKFAEERTRQLVHEREARIQAEAASRTKSDFLAMMSHELRTPLNAILGYSELIELGITGEITPKMLVQIRRIRVSARHLLGLVNDILDLAKVEAGQLSVANVPANASQAIAAALTLVQPQASARSLTLVVADGAAQLPAYIGDEERVRQILVNLLSNAVKCTEPGGTITIEGAVTTAADPLAQLQPRKAHIRLTVTDTGSGIPPDKLAEIFEPFVQADTGTKRAREGSGLGLTIGQRLARAMGGDLTVESTEGKGSAFHLWLPAETSLAELHGDDARAEALEASGGPSLTSRTTEPPADLRGLGDVARGIMTGLDALVTAVVERIRCDSALRMAAGLRTSQVTSQLPTLLANIVGALIIIADVGDVVSPPFADAMAIQRLIMERHGMQRARLGWTEASMRREFMIIREELDRVVRGAVPAKGPIKTADALASVNKLLDQAEYVSVRELEKQRPE